ncbi:MAG: prolyl oligopeptidase, partial [Myxococcota bacterium]
MANRLPLLLLSLTAGLTLVTACATAPKDVVKPAVEPVKATAMNDAAPLTLPPLAQRVDQVDILHGQHVEDPYRWLEDMSDARTKTWTAAQNDHARAHLAGIAGRDALTKRFNELFYVDAVSAPQRKGDRLFYTRRHKDKEKAIVYWRKADDGAETVLIDPNTLSEDGSTSLGGWYPSRDGALVAYTLKRNNADEATMYVRDVATGTDLRDVVGGAKYAYAAWTPDNSGFYYTYLPEGEDIPVADRPGFAEVRFHALGTEAKTDALVFPRLGDPEKFISPQLSRDGKYLLLYVHHGWNSTDIFFKTLAKPDAVTAMPPLAGPTPPMGSAGWRSFNARMLGFKPLVDGVDALFEVDIYKDRFYVLTNDQAARYRVMRVDPKTPARKDWTEIVAESDATIESVSVLGGQLVLRALKNASGDIEVRDLNGRLQHGVDLPSIGGVGGVVGNDDDDTAYFSFSSFTQPPEIHTLSVKSGATKPWARIELPIDTTAFEITQVWYPSKDATKVSMFIVHRRGIPLDGSHPTLLYG